MRGVPKKNVYMVQTSIKYENTLYLPYTVGTLAAFAWSDNTVEEQYTLKGLLCMRDDVVKTTAALENPFLVAFSNYIWNFEYNKALVREIKRRFPQCVIVFGGHNVPPDTSLLVEEPTVDILVHGEGEEAFRDLLSALHTGDDLSAIPNISYRNPNGKTVKTRCEAITRTDFPSPYAAGLFNDILAAHPEIRFSAILETNRGCPYACAFCDWCELTAKVRSLPRDRVLADLSWMAEHEIEFCYCADANFGILARDESFIDALIDLNIRHGFPKKFRVNYAKHNNETVFRINKKLNAHGISKGATISFQSLSPAVLEHIGRKNMSLNKFSELMALYGNAGIPTYSELILGLPGETYESFCDGIGSLLEAGQHASILIYNCELIANSRMADEQYMQKFGIRSVVTPLYLRHDEPDCEDIPEFSRSVTATAAMGEEDWINANLFSVTVQSCHGMGLLRYLAVWLFHEKNIRYQDFYNALIVWSQERADTVLGTQLRFLRGEFEKIAASTGRWSYTNPLFGNVSWPYEEGLYLNLTHRFDAFFQDLTAFLSRYEVEASMLEDLLLYQRSLIKVPGVPSFCIRLRYDFPEYFSGAMYNIYQELKAIPCEVRAVDNAIPEAWKDYAKEYIWFGRKEQRNIHLSVNIQHLP